MPFQDVEIRRFLLRTLRRPEKFLWHVRRLVEAQWKLTGRGNHLLIESINVVKPRQLCSERYMDISRMKTEPITLYASFKR